MSPAFYAMRQNGDMRMCATMRLVVSAACVAALVAGCRAKPEPRFATLAKGTVVPLILLKRLEAGGDSVGTVVPMMASENVVDSSGAVVVRKGALAFGKVVRSRGEHSLSGIANQPARLDVTVTDVASVDGGKLRLSADPGGDPSEPYHLTRANTGRIDGALDAAWSQKERQDALIKLAQLVESSKHSDLANNPQSTELLRSVAQQLGLQSTQTAAAKGDLATVATMLGQIGSGQIDTYHLAEATVSQVGSIIELTRVVGYVGERLGGALKGRTIRAWIGTPLKGYLAQDARVRIPAD